VVSDHTLEIAGPTYGNCAGASAGCDHPARLDSPTSDSVGDGAMTVFTLGPNEDRDGSFAEVHARNELDARKKVHSVDKRRNWFDLNHTYCTPIGSTATRHIAAGEVRIFERFEDLPPT
jgi:hypothetical protein